MTNPWLERRVLSWAHQGGAREGPSSTMWAMERAVEAGAHAIELDVHATKDGVVVVCHDPTVDRTTGATGRIADLTLEEIRALDNAHWWVPGEVVARGRADADYVHRGKAPADLGFGIPTLAEVLEAFPGTFLNFDIKQGPPAVPAYEQLVADDLRAHGRIDDVIVASFDDGTTARFREIAPEIATSLGVGATTAFFEAVRDGKPWEPTGQVALQVPYRMGEITVVTQPFVDRAHEEGLAVHVWTIDDEREMHELLDLGVDAIMTDRPAVLGGVLTQRGLAYAGPQPRRG